MGIARQSAETGKERDKNDRKRVIRGEREGVRGSRDDKPFGNKLNCFVYFMASFIVKANY